MSKEKRRVPKLRFPGFTEDWEQRKLGDLMEVTSVKRIHQADWTDSGVRFFRARDIVSSMNNEEVDNPVFISEDKYEEYSRISGKVIEGDLLVTGVGTIGVPYLIKDDTPLYFKDGNIIWFKNNNILNGKYFYYCFQNNHIQSQIYSASGKGTVGTYTIENGKKTSISYPSLKEQIKIGKLLDTMTIMITLHQRKLNNLKLKKKALLQKLFPKNGERYPELRFPGFTDAWEQRKFEDLFEYERPDAYIVKSDNYNNDFNMPVLTANKAFILGYTNEKNSYNKPSIIFDDFTLDRKYVDFPYMLKSSAIKILTSKNQHNLRFLFERLNSTRFEVLGHARHYISVVQNTTTLCPSVDEEVCISNLLTKFDELITLHQRKLDHLQLQKKALLQQMFV